MANVIHAIKEYEKSLTYYKEQEFIQCFEEMAEDAESNPDAEIRMVDEFNIRSLLYYFPIRDDAPEINKDTEAAAVYVTEQLNALCKDNEKSGFCHGCVATSVKDLKIFFEFIHDFYPMEMSLYRVLTETLSNDETVTGMIGITHEGETVDEFLMGLYDNSDITTLDKLNTVLHKCGIKPLSDKVAEYARKILTYHGCDETSYYGINGEQIVADLKEAYPDKMEYPYVEVANAIMSLSKPTFIRRSPYRMVFDMGHTVDVIDFDCFEAAQNDAIETLVQWMCEFTMENHIENNDLTTWTEKQKEDWDYMIYDCSVCVSKYDPDTDEYYTCWEPTYKDEEEIGWVPTEEFHKLIFR